MSAPPIAPAANPAQSNNPEPLRPKEEVELVRAVRALITEQTGFEPSPPKPVKLDWISFVFIAVFAADVSAAYWLLRSTLEHESTRFALGLIPSLFGAAFVAYTDRLRDWLFSRAKGRKFRIAVVVAAVLLVTPQAITYRMRVTTHPGLYVWVDDAPVSLVSRGNDTTITMRGFADHRLRVSEYQAEDRREDTIFLRRSDMVRASLRSLPLIGRILPAEPLALDTRWPVTVNLPNDRITFLRVLGRLPPAYRIADPRQDWAVGQVARDTDEMRVTLPGGAEAAKIHLPPSATAYHVSYVFGNCVSAAETVTVKWGRSARPVTLSECVQQNAGATR